MCARRFLFVIFLLTLITVGAAFAIYQWGSQMLIRSATPSGRFEAAESGSQPDYSRVEAWIAHPAIRNGPAHWRPDGALEARATKRSVAAFYVHPTTYLERDRWNAPIGDGQSRTRADLFVRSQASAFANVATVWAPRYRQAAYGAFLLDSSNARQALDLAYADVARAFDAFLRANPDGPLLLAGHSQGSLHLLRLLADRSEALRGRLVAAYVAGWPVGLRSDLPATGLQPCVAADQPGCLLSWQSFAEPANATLITDAWVGTPGLAGQQRRRDEMLCVDPVSGRRDGRSLPRDNPGTLVPTADLTSASLAEGRVGSRCEKGFLILDGAIPPLGPYVLPGNNYHVYDYALFWSAIARDAGRRAAAWR